MKLEDRKIAEATLSLLKRRNWNSLSLREIKLKSKIKSFDKLVDNKKAIIEKLNKYFDYKLILLTKNIEKSSNKDMIFEILMMRFDILQENRKGIMSIFNSFKSQPQDLLFLIPNIIESIILMIGYTNISLKGIIGQLNIKGITVIYFASFVVWLRDDSKSLEKTMKNLDKNLDYAGKVLNFIR